MATQIAASTSAHSTTGQDRAAPLVGIDPGDGVAPRLPLDALPLLLLPRQRADGRADQRSDHHDAPAGRELGLAGREREAVVERRVEHLTT